jgi:hypothetical protein
MRLAAGLAGTTLVLTVAASATADTEAGTPTTVPAPPIVAEQKTVVEGTVPDLVGRWLALAQLDLPGGEGKTRAAPALWEVSRPDDGQLVLTVRFAGLPPAQQKVMDEANAAERAWTPSAADLDAVGAGWATLPAQEGRVRQIETTITARDAFGDMIRNEPRARDALWVVQQRYDFDASAAPTIRQVFVYAVLDETGGTPTGNYTTTVLAAAPFPIPITIHGTFQLHRLPDAPRGLLGRLRGLFSGCARR